jgi:hypothetical protein
MASRDRYCAIFLLMATSFVPSFGQTNSGTIPNDAIYPGTHRSETSPSGAEMDDPVARRHWMTQRFGGKLTEAAKRRMIRAARNQQARYPLQSAGIATAGVPTWVSLGPTKDAYEQNGFFEVYSTDTGRLRTILQDPTNSNVVYILTSGGGLWKTTNFSVASPTWVPLTDSQLTTSGGAVAFGSSSQTLYLGFGDPFDNFATIGGAMVKSTNGGASWSGFVDLVGASQVRDVKVDTSTATDIVLVATDIGLFRSGDGGTTYTRVGGGSGQPFAGSSVWSLVRTSAGWLATTETNDSSGVGSIYISTDLGVTWNPITNTGGAFTGAGRTTLGVAVSGDSIVYAFAATSGDTDQLDLFRSTNGGQTWLRLNINAKVAVNPNFDQPNLDLMAGQAFYNQMILIDPADSTRNTVYLGGQLSMARTKDGGKTWTLISHWLGFYGLPYAHADYHAAAWGTVGGIKAMLVGNDGGLYYSTTYSLGIPGVTWSSTKNVGVTSQLVYSVISNPQVPGSILSGLQDNGTIVRSGTTSTFDQSFGGDGFGVGWSQANNGASLGDAEFDDIVSNLGHNPPNWIFYWQQATTGINLIDAGFYTNVATPTAVADPIGLTFFTTSVHSIYETTDGGAAWTTIGTSGSGGISSATIIRDVPHAIGVSPLDTIHIGVAGGGAGAAAGILLLTTNHGTSWMEVPLISLVSGYQGYNSNVAWANDSIIYVCSEAPLAGSVRVVKSTNGGINFSAANGTSPNQLPDVGVTKLQVDPRDSTGNTVYAATYLGLYQTTDGGSNWFLSGAGLPMVQVSDIYMPATGSFLDVSTFGRGIWQLPALTITTTTLPAGSVGVAYSQQLAASGGTPPYTWSLASGALPNGLNLSASGLISGTPTIANTFAFKVKAVDSSIKPQSATASLSIKIN